MGVTVNGFSIPYFWGIIHNKNKSTWDFLTFSAGPKTKN